jgi:uncharacterized protein (DUF433 family)
MKSPDAAKCKPATQIIHDPKRQTGEATIGQTRLPAEQIARCVWDGQDVEQVAADWELDPEEVRLACWWLAMHGAAPTNHWYRWARAWQGLPVSGEAPGLNPPKAG